MTNYESYPDAGNKECEENNGCTWAGQFAFLEGRKSKSWAKRQAPYNVISVHSKESKKYKLKTFQTKQGEKEIEAKVL